LGVRRVSLGSLLYRRAPGAAAAAAVDVRAGPPASGEVYAYAEVQALAGRAAPGTRGTPHPGACGIYHSESAGGEYNCTLSSFLSVTVLWYRPEQVKNS
jgi:hypothetical protein